MENLRLYQLKYLLQLNLLFLNFLFFQAIFSYILNHNVFSYLSKLCLSQTEQKSENVDKFFYF